MTVNVILPYALQQLAMCESNIVVEPEEPVSQLSVIRALEDRFPQLRGAILDHANGKRRPMIRFFAAKEDISHLSLDTPLAESVAEGREEFIIVGAISGG